MPEATRLAFRAVFMRGGTSRAVVAALALGAVGVWVGTAFLMAEESQIYPEHQAEIARGTSEDFVITRAYTGKTAREYRNEAIDAWERSGLSLLPMPLQGVLMDDFVTAAEVAGRPDLINNPVGQIGGMLTRRRPARDILLSMVEEAVQVIDRLDAMRVAVPQR